MGSEIKNSFRKKKLVDVKNELPANPVKRSVKFETERHQVKENIIKMENDYPDEPLDENMNKMENYQPFKKLPEVPEEVDFFNFEGESKNLRDLK